MGINSNSIIVRFSFLNKGSKLKANFKPRTGNITISATIVSHGELEVSYNLVDCILNKDIAKYSRATLCFNDPTRASNYIELINSALETNEVVCASVLTTGKIIYNAPHSSEMNAAPNKSLTIFNPDDIKVISYSKPFIEAPVVLTTPSLPIDETEVFDYSKFRPIVSNQPLPQVLASTNAQVLAARFLNVISKEQLDSLIADGITEDELEDYSDAELKELISLGVN